MVVEGIVLGTIFLGRESKWIHKDKTHYNVGSPKIGIGSEKLFGYIGFNHRFVNGYLKITKSLCSLLEKDVEFHFL